MRLRYFLFLFLGAPVFAQGANVQWFVAVYGENYQHVVGASATPDVPTGVFLQPDFVGKVMYVRSEEHYELDQFRRNDSPDANNTATTLASESAADAATIEAPAEELLKTEFGPLVDTGLQYYNNPNFHGWSCSNLYVQPLGDKVYRLRCEDDMQHN